MRKEISYEEFELNIDNKKNLIKNIIPNILLIIIIFCFILLFSRNLNLSIFLSFLLLSIYLIYIYKQLKNINKIIYLYEEQDDIALEKKEIKKYINKFRNLLLYLNLEETRINYNIDKYLNMISNANSLEDFRNITESLKEKIIKYSELLGEEEKYYNNQNNQYSEEILTYLNILELDKIPLNKKELKNHYRNLLKKYHPDNIKSNENNLTEKELEEKTSKINDAYNYINKKLN